jgi:hypothetical protein
VRDVIATPVDGGEGGACKGDEIEGAGEEDGLLAGVAGSAAVVGQTTALALVEQFGE